MDAGLFSKQILLTIPSGTASLDLYGQNIFSYYTASVWADVETMSGNQDNTSGIIHNTAIYNFTIRNRDDINEDTTITYNGQKYRITFINEFGKTNRYTLIVAQRRN